MQGFFSGLFNFISVLTNNSDNWLYADFFDGGFADFSSCPPELFLLVFFTFVFGFLFIYFFVKLFISFIKYLIQ